MLKQKYRAKTNRRTSTCTLLSFAAQNPKGDVTALSKDMMKYIGKISGCIGILLAVCCLPLGRELTFLINGNPKGPILSPTGGFDYCRPCIVLVLVIGAILTITGVTMEIRLGMRDKKEK